MDKENKPQDSVLTRSLVFGRPVSGSTIAALETLDGWGYITAGFSFLYLCLVHLSNDHWRKSPSSSSLAPS
jgi:hypothetical protein